MKLDVVYVLAGQRPRLGGRRGSLELVVVGVQRLLDQLGPGSSGLVDDGHGDLRLGIDVDQIARTEAAVVTELRPPDLRPGLSGNPERRGLPREFALEQD